MNDLNTNLWASMDRDFGESNPAGRHLRVGPQATGTAGGSNGVDAQRAAMFYSILELGDLRVNSTWLPPGVPGFY